MIVQDTQFLLNFVEGLFDTNDYGKVIDAVFRVTAERLQFDRLNIILFDDKGCWRRVARRDFSGTSIKAKYDQGTINDDILNLANRYQWKAQVIENYHTCPEAKDLPKFSEEGLRSGVHSYLWHKGKLLGVFSVQSIKSDFYCENDGIFLFEVGQVVAAALENIGDYRELVKTKKQLNEAQLNLPQTISHDDDYDDIIGFSPVMRQLKKTIDRVASTDTTVLISGATGTGKELVANAIHKRSGRSGERLVTVNCAALATELVSSELFGHVAGAFTGATTAYKGRFEVADKGTLFLDEIGDIPPETQTRLLRVLEEGKFERVGSTESISTDVRIIAATHQDLKEMVELGRFRADLLFRLNVFPIYVPVLRDRGDDIVDLAIHFAKVSALRINKTIPVIDDKAMETLRTYHWVGNVRELRNVIERAVILCDKGRIKRHMLPMDVAHRSTSVTHGVAIRSDKPEAIHEFTAEDSNIASHNGPLASLPSLEEVIRTHIIKALNRCNGKISGQGGAARLLELNPKTLESKMRKMGIQRHWR